MAQGRGQWTREVPDESAAAAVAVVLALHVDGDPRLPWLVAGLVLLAGISLAWPEGERGSADGDKRAAGEPAASEGSASTRGEAAKFRPSRKS